MSKITNISIIPTGPGKKGEALPSDVIFTLDDGSSYTTHTVIPSGIQGLRGSQWTSGGGAAPTDAISGDVFFNTSIGVLYQYDGTNWNTLGNFVGKKGDSGVGVSDITYTSTPMDPGSPIDTTITFHKTDNTQNDVVIQTPPGPQGANGGPDPYAGPNEVNFSWYEISSYGAHHTERVTFPYGLVFKYPPRVDVTFVMFFPSEQWNNYTDNWHGDVTPQFAYDNQTTYGTAQEITVSKTDFSFSQPGGWSSAGYIQYSVRGFIDPQKTADNQNKLGIKPPDRVQDISLSNLEIDQTTPTPGQNSQATWKATLSNGTIVQQGFTIPCGAQGLKGDPGAAGKDGVNGAPEEPQIGRVDGFYNYDSVPDTHLLLDGGTFDPNVYPELYAFLKTNKLQDFRGLFLRGRDPYSQWDTNNTIDRNADHNPTLEAGSMLVGQSTTGELFIEPSIVDMKLFGAKNTVNWDMNFPSGYIDAINQTNFSTTGSTGSSTPANSWTGINNGQGGIDQRLGMARPINMNVVWAIKAKTKVADTTASTSNSGGTGLAAGIAMWYSGTTPPAGWLVRDGGTFDVNKYPELAKLYPNGVLPDDRGLFIRGYDPTGIVDNNPNRQILSFEEGSYVIGDNNNNLRTVAGIQDGAGADGTRLDGIRKLNWDVAANQNDRVTTYVGSGAYTTATTSFGNSYDGVIGISRPKNRNYLPIISTGL